MLGLQTVYKRQVVPMGLKLMRWDLWEWNLRMSWEYKTKDRLDKDFAWKELLQTSAALKLSAEVLSLFKLTHPQLNYSKAPTE